MSVAVLSKATMASIDRMVQHYEANQWKFKALLESLTPHLVHDEELKKHTHSMRFRLKDPQHLRDKLERRALEAAAKKARFLINEDNLFRKVNDLAGCRLLHLYTRQFGDIDRALVRIFREQRYRILEKAKARTWDDESREYFRSIGVGVVNSKTMYTSVHYVLMPNQTSELTLELQVRTLAEEVWGEVDHTINYPHPSKNVPCVEQIKVLARLTSSCSRLVDSIFKAHEHAGALRLGSADRSGDPAKKREPSRRPKPK